MSKEQEKLVIDALVEFVLRVSKGKTINEKELEILPKVVLALTRLFYGV